MARAILTNPFRILFDICYAEFCKEFVNIITTRLSRIR